MPAVVLLGAQWGDEGKGKLTDILSSQADFTVRYQGGANAGHTLKAEGEEIIVHLIPSAVLRPKAKCLISSGAALDIFALCEEIKSLQKIGRLKDSSQLLISDSASLLLDHHKKLDQAREKRAGEGKLGTTGRGIGPAYESRAGRKALIFADLFKEDFLLLEKLKRCMAEENALLTQLYGQGPVSPQKLLEKMKACQSLLEPYRCGDMPLLLHEALRAGKTVLFEGAQGALLDLLHGSYPYVTSSSTLAGGALPSAGLGWGFFSKTIAVAKAYTTRVGLGPFPTELEGGAGLHLQERGGEFGATTGRKRRCGWLDLPALKYALRLNGASSLALMKLDVLSGLKEIKVCRAYETNSGPLKNFPAFLRGELKARPLYQSFKGWNQDISAVQSKKDLPPSALAYIDFICRELNIPIDFISVGPSREQTLCQKSLF